MLVWGTKLPDHIYAFDVDPVKPKREGKDVVYVLAVLMGVHQGATPLVASTVLMATLSFQRIL